MAQIVVQTPDGKETAVELTDRAVAFGRADDCDVVLAEQRASRRHCTVRPSREGWRVVDEGSSNGTWLGGKCVLSAHLQGGDEIEIGETVLTYVEAPGERKPLVVTARRAPRRTPLPWGALGAGIALAAAAWFGAGAMRDTQAKREAAAWKRLALAEIARAEHRGDETEFRMRLAVLGEEMHDRPLAADALAIVRGAAARGLPAAPGVPATVSAWKRALDVLDATRARMTAAERRSRLRELLSRNIGDADAVAAFADSLRLDETAAQERDAAAAAQSLADGDRAFGENEWGRAIEAWTAWSAASPTASREAEASVAARMGEARTKAKSDAEAAFAAHQAQTGEGRLAAATSIVDAALPRLRGTGWDVWLTGRTRRPSDAPGRDPTARGGAPAVDARALLKERVLSIFRSSEEFVRQRRFAQAGVLLRESAATIEDPPLRAELETRAADLAAESELLALVLSQVRTDPKPFGTVPGTKTVARVEGATEDAVLLAEGKSEVRAVPVAEAPGATLAALVGKAKLESSHWIAAALLARDLGEVESYTAWMLRALDDASLQPAASAVHARMLSGEVPEGGFVRNPDPKQPNSIVSFVEGQRFINAKRIADDSADLAKLVEQIEASKQAKSIARVAEVYAKLEAARQKALELIFDEVKYFYPYKSRMKEYGPVQREVNDLVAAVREQWADTTSAKVRTDAALDKLLQKAKDLRMEIGYLGGDVDELAARFEKVERYLGREITVQNYFETEADRKLHEWNAAILDHNAKLRGAVDDSEREQVRITNEYRRMFGHRRLLRLHEKLVLAARGHSDDMAKIGFFDHTSPVAGKTTPWDRMTLAGYPNVPCSENIHAGGGDAQTAHDGWAHSSGHHRNILMPAWSELGTGRSGNFWTQNFGYDVQDDAAGGPGPK